MLDSLPNRRIVERGLQDRPKERRALVEMLDQGVEELKKGNQGEAGRELGRLARELEEGGKDV